MKTDDRPIWNVEIQINLSIPMHAATADEAIEPAMAQIERHLSDGNYIADVLTVTEQSKDLR